ncbi:MAG: transcription-repair coupling factor [bacterium]
MKHSSTDIFSNLEFIEKVLYQIKNKHADENKVFISGLPGSSKTILINRLTTVENQIVLLVPDIKTVSEYNVELHILELKIPVIALEEMTPEIVQEKLTQLNTTDKFILVADYDLLKLSLPPKDIIEKNTLALNVGSNISYDELIEYLNEMNYQRDKFVEGPGDYSVRGSIIDFWSYSEKQPVRAEYDGDFLESLRHFDPESQRSSDKITHTSLAAKINPSDETNNSSIFDYLNDPLIIASSYELENIFTNKKEILEPEESYLSGIEDELKEELFGEANKITATEESEDFTEKTQTDLETIFKNKARWLIEEDINTSGKRSELNLAHAPIINSNFEYLFELIKEYAQKDYIIFIAAENELQAGKLRDLLSGFKEELSELFEAGKIKIISLAVKEGFISKPDKILILSDYQIFNKPYRTKIISKKYKKSKAKEFASIKRGDFVVHETYGIGQYSGLETIKIGMVEQECIKILYANNDIVYVNLNYLGLVKKFSSAENVPPALTNLSSNEWKSTKSKVKAKIKDAAFELISLYAKRKSSKGFSFNSDTIWQKELEASFIYEDTPDQEKITEEVKLDMETENPMDRLVCGDVGFGKTEIAVRAAFKAVNDSKQVAVLVPTTILAEQHYNTFKDRLNQFPVRVAALSRFSTKAKQTETVKKLADGGIDIVIGTHRLLSKDVAFKDLGLLIIDEEHRFGVMAKEKLRKIKANVDTLTLTATPIPRTLNMSLLGARDLSIMATPPPNRQPIYTKVEKFDIVKIREWIHKELNRHGQVYFVHDRVQSIEKIAGYVRRYIPDIKIAVAHGQMRPAQLEQVIYDFLNKEYNVLMSTKIIESGLDIPNVNTIIINRADRFGLAELHQLRGRVGRSNRQAFAYMLVPSLDTITKKAVRRLQAIEEYTDLGEGFNISMRDLEIRGAGNLLGTEQSGVIESIGFDLYVKLLDEAVEELKRDQFKEVFKDLPKHIERTDPTIDAFFEIGIPKTFMPDQADRLSFYTALFSMLRVEEAQELKEEIKDRFGKLPGIVERLVSTAILRYYASYALFERIVIQPDRISILLPKGEKEEYYTEKFAKLMQHVVDKYYRQIQFKQTKDVVKLEMRNHHTSPEAVLEYLIKFSREIQGVISNVATN